MNIGVKFTCPKCGRGNDFPIDVFDLENDVEVDFEELLECRHCGRSLEVKATACLSVDFTISVQREEGDPEPVDPNQIPLFGGTP